MKGAEPKDPEDFYRARTASGSSTNALSRGTSAVREKVAFTIEPRPYLIP